MSDRFDPFTDRKSREIRNRLSAAFMHAIDIGDPALFESVIFDLLNQDSVDSVASHQSYVNDRARRYREAFAEIESRELSDQLAQALVLWNHGLFFEAHERLEAVWKESSGDHRDALKGLIQAAGVFMHMEYGRQNSANRLASKARNLLIKHGNLLPIDVAELVDVLKEGLTQAPKL